MTGEAFRLVPDDPDALYCTTLIEKSFEPDLKLDLLSSSTFPATSSRSPSWAARISSLPRSGRRTA